MQRRERLRLIDHRLAEGRYPLHPADAAGRVRLVIANVWLGIEGDHVVCYDEQGVAFGDYATVVQQAAAERARAQAAEAQARREAEARLRALEEELRRLHSAE